MSSKEISFCASSHPVSITSSGKLHDKNGTEQECYEVNWDTSVFHIHFTFNKTKFRVPLSTRN